MTKLSRLPTYSWGSRSLWIRPFCLERKISISSSLMLLDEVRWAEFAADALGVELDPGNSLSAAEISWDKKSISPCLIRKQEKMLVRNLSHALKTIANSFYKYLAVLFNHTSRVNSCNKSLSIFCLNPVLSGLNLYCHDPTGLHSSKGLVLG